MYNSVIGPVIVSEPIKSMLHFKPRKIFSEDSKFIDFTISDLKIYPVSLSGDAAELVLNT